MPSPTQHLLTTLRALLCDPPSAHLWDTLCTTLERSAFDPIALEYTLEHLRAWPTSLRVAPPHWTSLLHTDQSPLHTLAPLVHHLTFSYCPVTSKLLDQWARIPTLQHINSLCVISPTNDPNLLNQLFATHPLPNLHTLSIHEATEDNDDILCDDAFPSILQHLPNLQHLHVYGVLMGASWAGSQAHFGHIVQYINQTPLQSLTLSGTHLAPQQISTILQPNIINHLKFLDLSSNFLSDPQTLEALQNSHTPPLLQHLSLRECGLLRGETKPVYNALNAPLTHNIHTLDLTGNRLTHLAIPPLQYSTKLQRLDLSHNQITSLPHLANLTTLHHLNLSNNPLSLSTNDLSSLFHTPHALQSLDLSNTTLPHKLLQTPQTSSTLQRLTLRENNLTSHATQHLSQWSLPALRHLDLSFNHLDPSSIEHFTQSPTFQHLQHLDLSFNPIPTHTPLPQTSNTTISLLEGNAPNP